MWTFFGFKLIFLASLMHIVVLFFHRAYLFFFHFMFFNERLQYFFSFSLCRSELRFYAIVNAKMYRMLCQLLGMAEKDGKWELQLYVHVQPSSLSRAVVSFDVITIHKHFPCNRIKHWKFEKESFLFGIYFNEMCWCGYSYSIARLWNWTHGNNFFFEKIYTIFVCGIAFCLAHNTVMGSQWPSVDFHFVLHTPHDNIHNKLQMVF